MDLVLPVWVTFNEFIFNSAIKLIFQTFKNFHY